MVSSTAPFMYSFSRTYFQNFKANLTQSAGFTGEMNVMMEDYWKQKNTSGAYEYRKIGADGTDRGISIKRFVNDIYDGSQPVCLLDKIAREMARITYQVFDAVGLGDIGCSLSQAFSNVIDSFTNVFGSFICTATVENMKSGCHKDMLDVMKAYRDNVVMTDAKGLRIVKYYSIVGVRIVEEINKDDNKELVYQDIMNRYLVPIHNCVNDDGDKRNVFGMYFKMMDEMVIRYDIKVSKEFKQWVKEYTHGM